MPALHMSDWSVVLQIHGPKDGLQHLEGVLKEFVGGRNIHLTYKPFDATTAAAIVANSTMSVNPIILQPDP
eukprot:2619463-Pyramimonas_sp.AAC.1